tara:strand:- start:6636 stop:7187 length:552 start_codon:yes stop_codon:yes gene_type:complete
MIVEVNTEVLKELGISSDDFLYLYLLHAKHYDLLSNLSLRPNPEDLQTKGLIKLGEELQDHTVRQDFLDMFQVPFDQMWSELLSHFPIKVHNQGHLRILRAASADAKNNAKAKKAYERVIGEDKKKHDHIVQCLKNELELRKSTNTLGYMQMLQTWVNRHTWEQYEQKHEQPTESTGRITRTL